MPPRGLGGGLALLRDRHFLVVAAVPALVVMIGVTLVPFMASIALAFTDYNLNAPGQWQFVGLDNFGHLLADRRLPTILFNTGYMVIGIIVAEVVVGMALAVLLRTPIRGITFIRSIYLLPVMTAPIVVALVWRTLYNVSHGWLNYFLGLLGLPTLLWTADPVQAMPSVILSDMWTGVPFMAILFLAGLVAVPVEHVEAARIDGASSWRVFWSVELPAIQSIVILAVLFRTMTTFKKFEGITQLTGGGPGDATSVLNLEVYYRGFRMNDIGGADALAVVGTVIVTMMLGVFYLLMRRVSR